jgi:hypothetical protein
MNNPQSTDLTGTLITDLIDMVQKLMGIDPGALGACGNSLWGRPTLRLPGLTPEPYNWRRYGRSTFAITRTPHHDIVSSAQSTAQ